MIKHNGAVTAQDVANRAGVSRAAVSRVFTNNGSVAKATREKIVKAAQELGYQVNFLAQGLNRKRSLLIGVVVTRLSDPFRSALLESLLTEIQTKGLQALVTEVAGEDELASTIRRFTQFRVSGVVVTSGQPPSNLVKECVCHDIPVVVINRLIDLPNVDVVCSDNQMGAKLAVQQFLSTGCKQLAWLNYQDSTWSGVARGQAFRQILQDGYPSLVESLRDLVAHSASYDGGRQAAHDFCQTNNTIDAIFCANAQLACGFLDGMRENGLDAPQDFQIIGFDNTPQTAQYSYRLSTISQNIQQIVKLTLVCLEERAQNPDSPQTINIVPVDLVLRHTSLQS